MQNLHVDQNKDSSNSNEGYEDAESDAEWNGTSACIDLYGIASAAGRLAGNLNTRPGALDDFFNKLKLLEQEWYEAERRYQGLQIEKDKVVTQLENERTKSAMYQKKLRFIQDNQKNFERLKQVYMNMRYQESTGRSMVEIRERSSQTVNFPGSEVASIVSTLSRESLVSVKKSELSAAQENLKALKEMVKKREQSWALNTERENTFKQHISILQNENDMLNQLMKAKDMEIQAMRLMEETKVKSSEEGEECRRIIWKMDRRLRELERVGKIGRYNVIFNEQERKVVQEIVDKDSTVADQSKPHRMHGISTVNRTSSVPVPKVSNRPPVKMTQSQNRDRGGSGGMTGAAAGVVQREPIDEMRELEFLAKIKREIEMKQASLKDKVQEMIDSTDVPAACPLSATKK